MSESRIVLQNECGTFRICNWKIKPPMRCDAIHQKPIEFPVIFCISCIFENHFWIKYDLHYDSATETRMHVIYICHTIPIKICGPKNGREIKSNVHFARHCIDSVCVIEMIVCMWLDIQSATDWALRWLLAA